MATSKIFVGGLSWATTEENLRFHFERYGTVESTMIMTDRATGNSRGFGFVTFVEADTVNIVCKERHMVSDKYIDVKPAVDREKAPPSIHGARVGNAPAVPGGGTGASTDYKLFVGGLRFETSTEALQRYFEGFGRVAHAEVMLEPGGTRSRGFGFVRYEQEADMAKALQHPAHMIDGARAEVKPATAAGRGPAHTTPVQSLRNASVCPVGENPAYWALARGFGRTGWRAGYGTHAWGPEGFGVPGWEGSDVVKFKGSFGFRRKPKEVPQEVPQEEVKGGGEKRGREEEEKEGDAKRARPSDQQ
ncbi:hypothetical protein TeGR_g1547 [Tetraparma gracilis]|uniref:RRM domain-containing protein n=1 Tax=Tetraparma gracilis TaxID=2962635 RepID=A0ABQ6MCJ6_9STRA|nr:hypothetical protein TeGR_g1547 [Tetraparma gracilis]